MWVKRPSGQRVEIADLGGINPQKERVSALIVLRGGFSHRMEQPSASSARLEEPRRELANQNVGIADLDGISPGQERVNVLVVLQDSFSHRMEPLSALSARLADLR